MLIHVLLVNTIRNLLRNMDNFRMVAKMWWFHWISGRARNNNNEDILTIRERWVDTWHLWKSKASFIWLNRERAQRVSCLYSHHNALTMCEFDDYALHGLLRARLLKVHQKPPSKERLLVVLDHSQSERRFSIMKTVPPASSYVCY